MAWPEDEYEDEGASTAEDYPSFGEGLGGFPPSTGGTDRGALVSAYSRRIPELTGEVNSAIKDLYTDDLPLSRSQGLGAIISAAVPLIGGAIIGEPGLGVGAGLQGATTYMQGLEKSSQQRREQAKFRAQQAIQEKNKSLSDLFSLQRDSARAVDAEKRARIVAGRKGLTVNMPDPLDAAQKEKQASGIALINSAQRTLNRWVNKLPKSELTKRYINEDGSVDYSVLGETLKDAAKASVFGTETQRGAMVADIKRLASQLLYSESGAAVTDPEFRRSLENMLGQSADWWAAPVNLGSALSRLGDFIENQKYFLSEKANALDYLSTKSNRGKTSGLYDAPSEKQNFPIETRVLKDGSRIKVQKQPDGSYVEVP